MAIWILRRLPLTTMARWYAALGIAATFFLVRLITRRIAMEALR
jgi:hypothetical protein